jgi:hypothetical protein
MRILRNSLAALALALGAAPMAHGYWAVGVRVGPGPYWRGCYRPYPFYPVIAPSVVVGVGVAPAVAPVYVAPAVVAAPVVVTAAPPAPSAAPSAAPAPAPANNNNTQEPPQLHQPTPVPPVGPTPAAYNNAPNQLAPAGGAWDDLSSANERVRADAVMQLARTRDRRAVRPLRRMLRNDPSPAVREAAARGLGLIGAPVALPALQDAAQEDADRDVRRSAAFSAEVIRANLRRP